ncbi:hypothetical protein ABW19_dt0202517 [Dactylella cylindrospora]|nr:hypothetical protein ABW19_dt0202517 [Dactylella cylindrospora]
MYCESMRQNGTWGDEAEVCAYDEYLCPHKPATTSAKPSSRHRPPSPPPSPFSHYPSPTLSLAPSLSVIPSTKLPNKSALPKKVKGSQIKPPKWKKPARWRKLLAEVEEGGVPSIKEMEEVIEHDKACRMSKKTRGFVGLNEFQSLTLLELAREENETFMDEFYRRHPLQIREFRKSAVGMRTELTHVCERILGYRNSANDQPNGIERDNSLYLCPPSSWDVGPDVLVSSQISFAVMCAVPNDKSAVLVSAEVQAAIELDGEDDDKDEDEAPEGPPLKKLKK